METNRTFTRPWARNDSIINPTTSATRGEKAEAGLEKHPLALSTQQLTRSTWNIKKTRCHVS